MQVKTLEAILVSDYQFKFLQPGAEVEFELENNGQGLLAKRVREIPSFPWP